MSPNIEEKLSTFSTLVMRDAQEKRDEIMEQTEKEYTERLDEKETEILEGAYENIQQNIREAHKDANERVLHKELEAKKKLIVKREELIESVMNEARERLADFTKSGEYENWLIEKTKKALFELGEGAKIVYISSDDVDFKEKIEALGSDVTVKAASERGFSGGIKAENTDRRVAVDYSFKELIAEQKQKFLRESGLSLG